MTEPAPHWLRVSDLPSTERPRERLARLGPQALTTAELIAILLRTGTTEEPVLQLAGRLLAEHQGLRGLASLEITQLINEHGMGPAKATTIASAFELGRRLAVEGDAPRPAVTTPADIAWQLQAEMELLPQEEVRVLTLDTRHRLLSKTTLYRGSLNSSPARVADLFREAVRQNAAAIAIAHNHPSGDPAPSPDDIQFTKTIVAAGQLMQIEVLDHLVFGHGRYVSLRERRLGFE